MNSPILRISAVIGFAIFFTVLFYKQSLGLNLLLFEAAVIGMLFLFKRLTIDKEVLLVLGGTVVTAALVVIHNSVLSIFVNLVSLFLLIGTLLLPTARSLPHSALLAVVHSVLSQLEFFKELGKLGNVNSTFGTIFKWIRIVVIPLLIVLVFVAMYSAANPVFDGMLEGVSTMLDQLMNVISKWIEVAIVFFFIFGMLVCDFLLLKTEEKNLQGSALRANDDLVRNRKINHDKKLDLGLKREWRSGIILILALNALLLLINVIDMYWVWFNFEWEGDYLKQFVHEGTYMLIFSILISIAISMYLFRGNQNFFSNNIWLKRLTIAWLAQNMVLAFSVGIRNFHYIQYYALAHKRIGVVFFLLATIIGLALVMIKIRDKKTFHFVLRTNAVSVYCILVLMSLVNWDVRIAKYNFSHSDRSFVHLNFMARLSDAALPYLETNWETLNEIEQGNTRFPSRVRYMTPEEYLIHLENRKIDFRADFESRDWRSWNLAYQRAYNLLYK